MFDQRGPDPDEFRFEVGQESGESRGLAFSGQTFDFSRQVMKALRADMTSAGLDRMSSLLDTGKVIRFLSVESLGDFLWHEVEENIDHLDE